MEAESLGQGEAQGGEIFPAGGAFQAHQRAAQGVERLALQAADLSGQFADAAGRRLKIVLAVRPGSGQIG